MILMTLDEIARALGARRAADIAPMQVTGVSTDTRTLRPGDLYVAIRGERFDGHDFVPDAFNAGAVGCVTSHDTAAAGEVSRPNCVLRVADTVEALGRLAAHHRQHTTAPVVAVTGSNGKTTTKCMIEHVLGTRMRGRGSVKSFNNRIGLPLALLSAEVGDEFLVVEIGSNAPGEVAGLGRLASPDIAVITSMGHAHVGGFGGLDGVRAEKLSLFGEVRAGGLCVVPLDDLARPINRHHGPDCTYVTFGTSDQADIRVSQVHGDLDRVRFTLNGKFAVEMPVPGRHNATNAAAAFAVCRRFRMEPEEIVQALSTFHLPDMRLSKQQAGGVTVIDDSYNANPTSMAAAIATLASVSAGRRVFVAGDMLELGDASDHWHAAIGRQLVQAGIELIIGVGPAAERIVDTVAASAGRAESVHYPDTERARQDLPRRLEPGDTVLLKGSRRIGLEQLARAIRDYHGEPAAVRVP